MMPTESFTYKNVISDDATAERFIEALKASASFPNPRSKLIPEVEESQRRGKEILTKIFSL
jgi:hypothetical protein